jgi:tetratricopeptide (TPR) repeat protein
MYKEAIASYKQAIRLDPAYPKVHLGLGISYDGLGMNKEAIEAFKQAIRINPDNADAHFCLGCMYVEVKNDRGSALEQYKILKNLDTERANILFNMIYKE